MENIHVYGLYIVGHGGWYLSHLSATSPDVDVDFDVGGSLRV